MSGSGGAAALKPRILSLKQISDAAALCDRAVEEYDIIRMSELPQLPASDARSPTDGSPAVVWDLRVRRGPQPEHVDRGLFNIVTGTGAAVSKLRIEGLNTQHLADAAGVTLLIPGMTYALLLCQQQGGGVPMRMPPTHSVDEAAPDQQLTVLAVKLMTDIPLSTTVLGCSSLFAALLQYFGLGQNAQTQAMQQGAGTSSSQQQQQQQHIQQRQQQQQQEEETQERKRPRHEIAASAADSVVLALAAVAALTGSGAPGAPAQPLSILLTCRELEQEQTCRYRLLPYTRLQKVFDHFAAEYLPHKAMHQLRFLSPNVVSMRVFGDRTPADYDMEDGHEISVMFEREGD